MPAIAVKQAKKFVMCKSTCKCRFCPKCAVAMGREVRDKLRIVLASFTSIQMWTLTVDPKRFASPREAHNWVQRKRVISKLVASLNSKGYLFTPRYFWVLEFHQNGWPHWHLLLDASFIPFEYFRDEFNRIGTGSKDTMLGMVQFSKGRGATSGKFDSSRHAAFYATKYITKEPEQGWPEWVLQYNGNIMRYRGSNGLFSHDAEAMQSADASENRELLKAERGPYKKTETVAVRIATCGNAGLVYFRRGYSWRYLGRIPHGAESMERWFGEPAWEIPLALPGHCEATDRLIWSFLGMADCDRGYVNMLDDGEVEIMDFRGRWSDTESLADPWCDDDTFDNPEWMGED